MKNNALFSTLFIDDVRCQIELDDPARGRMATLAQTWSTSKRDTADHLWRTFMKQALGYLGFVPANRPSAPGVYPLYEDFGFENCIALLFLVEPGADIGDTAVGRFWPAKLIVELKRHKLNWGILTDGSAWRLYSAKSSRPFEDYVELSLADALAEADQAEYGLFERFFHKDSFIPEEPDEDHAQAEHDEAAGVYKCRLDSDQEASEAVLAKKVKQPLLGQVDEILRYLCNGFIAETPRKGEEYTEEERKQIFESAVKLMYRCLFLFYAEARRLLPSEADKADIYEKHSIHALCTEAHKFRWGQRNDTDGYDLWKHFKGLINAVNDGDPEYGIMAYNGGLFDDEEEVFLGRHKLRNDFFARPLYLLAYVEPFNNDRDDEYEIPYEDLEVRHLGELYENILEYTVMLADADRIRRRTKKGVQFHLASETTKEKNDSLIRKGDVYFGESALERKQTGSYYTPESLVRFLNGKAIIEPLREKFEADFRPRFDQFLAQAGEKEQAASAASAIRSASALVQRYVDQIVLPFKACDPAMGSGHFLVDAANQMAGLVVELLAEIPPVAKLGTEITSAPNDWRRRITRHCLYGVDLNPLAVNLAKLSLWLNCFATQHRLTFLDHHLRCGNSLIGLRDLDQLRTVPKRKKDPKRKTTKQADLPFKELPDVLGDAAEKTRSITAIDEDDTDQQKEVFEEAHETADAMIAPLADLFTAYLMDYDIAEDDYRFLFRHFAKGNSADDLPAGRLAEIWDSVEAYEDYHHFFHWPVRFPEVFGPDADGGFAATVGNPPWDIVKPNSQEFFSNYDPKFRSYKKQQANKVSKTLMERNPAVEEAWETYTDAFVEQSTYFKQASTYPALGKGDINTFKLFLGQFFYVLKPDGRMGIVAPSGIYTDQGCQPLRQLFFSKSRIDFLYCFENKRGIFNIHRMFKFVIFGTTKGGKTNAFKCAFMEHDPLRLPSIEANALEMTTDQVRRFSPDTLSVMEFRTQSDMDITSTIYAGRPLLGQLLDDCWESTLAREFDMTLDSAMFEQRDSDGGRPGYRALWEGKQLWLLSYGLAAPVSEVADADICTRATTMHTRVAYRALASNTNERTLVATVVPKGLPTGNSLIVCPLPPRLAMVTAAILSSFVIDWLIRGKVTTNLNMFMLRQMPLLEIDVNDPVIQAVVARASRLTCTTDAYQHEWSEAFVEEWRNPGFWYPNTGAELDSYGPQHERDARKHLQESGSRLTQTWSFGCGLHDRAADFRDTGARAQLRAEIDAYVAHLYGVTRKQFEYVLSKFPVLERKERAAFGEFMSKRKCLEEYDRIGVIL